MRAARLDRFGGPEQLRTVSVADPVPGPDQCLIEVVASDVLVLETMLRAGGGGPMAPELPWIPGNGIAGRVAAVGAGGDETLVGRRVAAHTGNRGGYAERAVVPAADVVVVPDALELTDATALLHDGPTALTLRQVTRLGADDAVLVLGASGGLGIVLLQLARAAGARVVAVARGSEKLARIAALGPDAVVDSDRADWPDAARDALGATGATVILDNVGASLGTAAFELLAAGGRFSAHGTPSGAFTELDPDRIRDRGATVTGIGTVQLDPPTMAARTAEAFAACADGILRPVIGQTFPLERAADAHAALESRDVFGKTLLLTGR